MESVATNEDTRKRTISERRARFTQPCSPSSSKVNDDELGHVDDSIKESLSKEDVNDKSPNGCSHGIVAFVIVGGLLLILCWRWSSLAAGSDSNSSPDALVYYQMAALEKSFPGQNPRLWAVLKATIIAQTRFSASWNADAKIDGAPKVLLISPSSDPAKNESYQRFLRHFENSLGNMKDYWQCAVIDPFKSLLNISPDKVKRNLLDQMMKAYRSGLKCLHIVGIDRLSGDVAVALHGNTDPLNSQFKDAFLLFSIQKPPKISSQTSQREMETALRNHLRSLWEKDLGGDETYALINRLTGRIGIFEI